MKYKIKAYGGTTGEEILNGINQKQDANKGLLKTALNVAAPAALQAAGVPMPVGSMLTNAVTSMFADGGNMKTTKSYGGFASKIAKSAGTHNESAYGGVPIGSNNLAEGGEFVVNDNDGSEDKYVIPHTVNGTNAMMWSKNKTYADHLDNKLKKHDSLGRLSNGDKITSNTAKKDIDSIINTHKEHINLMDSADNELMSKGGTIHIKPENKGKFNATKARTGKSTEELTHSSNPITKKRAIFAQNAAKWKHEDGRKVIDEEDMYYNNPINNISYLTNALPSYLTTPFNEVVKNKEQKPVVKSNPISTWNKNPEVVNNKFSTPENKPVDSKNTNTTNNLYKGLLTGVQGLAGLDMIRQGIKGGDEVAFDKVNPKTVSAQPAINLARTQANRITAGSKAAVRGNAKTAGELIAGNAAADANLLDSTGSMMAQTKYGADMGNASIINQARQYNAGVGIQEAIARQQEQDAARSAVTTGLSQLGSTAAQTGKDMRLFTEDDKYKEMMGNLMDTQHYNYNPATGERIIKAFGGKLKYTKKK